MSEPELVFENEAGDLVVNFTVFSGREATRAEVDRLARQLLEEVASVEIICERRFEFDREVEATASIVRVRLSDRTGRATDLVEAWAEDCIAERSVV